MENHFKVLDIKKLMNHKVLYKLENIDSISLFDKSEIYLIYPKEGLKLDEIELCNEYIYEFNGNRDYDNIICEGQVINFPMQNIREILIIGYCDFGTVSDYLDIIGENYIEKCEFVMKTIQSDSWQGIDNSIKNVNCKTAFSMMGHDGQKHKIYYWKASTENKLKKYSSIKLPFNISIHIISIVIF